MRLKNNYACFTDPYRQSIKGTFYVDPEKWKRLNSIAKERGYRSRNAFIRATLEGIADKHMQAEETPIAA